MDVLEYYASQGAMSSPRHHAALFQGLPGDVGSLVGIVQGLMIHVHWLERYGLELPKSRTNEVQLRSVASKIDRIMELDPRPLTEARSMDKRLVGNCRDFSLMLTSMLRHVGIPSRARCGFARYFSPGWYEDHWVCEYWNSGERRWVLVDAQLDEFQREFLKVSFDPLDVPRDQFLPAGEAWRLCRSGRADPDRFGIFHLHGLWFIRGNLVRDVAALNKVELLPWDLWGLADAGEREPSEADLALLDHAADLTRGDVPHWHELKVLYETDERLRVPEVIRSYTSAGVREVRLGELR